MSSIQFRSRIKPAFNYGDTLNSYGVCCGTTGNNNVVKSFIECFNEGGYFIPTFGNDPSTISCPDSDTRLGCCCACAYMDPNNFSQLPPLTSEGIVAPGYAPYLSSGFQSNVSRCDCDRRGGKWTEGACPTTLTTDNTAGTTGSWQYRCLKGLTTDARVPRSCCYMSYDAFGFAESVVCTNQCTSRDCADLGTSTYPAIFGDSRCDVPVIYEQPTTNCVTGRSLSLMTTRTTDYDESLIGSCFTLGLSGDSLKYNCALTPRISCGEYWVQERDQNNPYCSSSYKPSDPQLFNGRYQPQIMLESDFNDIGLTAGDSFQGGVYIGTFYTPNAETTSEVYGNLSFGEPVLAKYNADNIGLTYEKWAVIVNTDSYTVPFLLGYEREVDYTTSLWDGYYNTYGDNKAFTGLDTVLLNTIKYENRKGFIDYYLPSIYELMFYAEYLRVRGIKNVGVLLSSSLFNAKYVSNENKGLIDGSQFVYGLSISSTLNTSTQNYRTVLINAKNAQTVNFFRRIILT